MRRLLVGGAEPHHIGVLDDGVKHHQPLNGVVQRDGLAEAAVGLADGRVPGALVAVVDARSVMTAVVHRRVLKTHELGEELPRLRSVDDAAEPGVLKFNVYVDGVEKTDPSSLQFSVSAVDCAFSAGEDPVDFTSRGGTQLRYEGGSFIQSSRTPSVRGCYVVRMTTTADGLSLNALFNVK